MFEVAVLVAVGFVLVIGGLALFRWRENWVKNKQRARDVGREEQNLEIWVSRQRGRKDKGSGP